MLNSGEDMEVGEHGKNKKEHDSVYGQRRGMDQNLGGLRTLSAYSLSPTINGTAGMQCLLAVNIGTLTISVPDCSVDLEPPQTGGMEAPVHHLPMQTSPH